MVAALQDSFLGGEWSSTAQGRMTDPLYGEALASCLNFIPQETGAITRRPGLFRMGSSRANAIGRTFTWQFAEQDPYDVEFTPGWVRFWAGNQLATTNDDTALASTAAGTATLGTARASWKVGDHIYFIPLTYAGAVGCASAFDREWRVTGVAGAVLTLVDIIDDSPFPGAGMTNVTHVDACHVLELPSPYNAGEIAGLRVVQGQNQYTLTAILLYQGVPPYQLVATLPSNFPAEFAQFTLTEITFNNGPYNNVYTVPENVFSDPTLGPNVGAMFDLYNWVQGGTAILTLDNSQISSIESATAPAAGDSGQGFQASDTGRMIHIMCMAAPYNPNIGNVSGTVYFYRGNNFLRVDPLSQESIQGESVTTYPVTTGVAPDAPAYLDEPVWALRPQDQMFTWGIISGVISSTQITVDVVGPSAPSSAIYAGAVQLGTYMSGVYPSCGAFYQGRLWLGGAVNNRFDGSSAGTLFDFTPTDVGGQVDESCAIAEILNSDEVNPIFWMDATVQGLVLGTQACEWLIQPGSSASSVISPSSITSQRSSRFGSANIEPVRTGLTSVFVQRYNRRLLEYLPDFFGGRFFSTNLAKNAMHLTEQGIQYLAFTEIPTPTVWVMVNGTLVGTAYRRLAMFSSQPPVFNAWHKHIFGTGDLFTSNQQVPVGAITNFISGSASVQQLSEGDEEPQSGLGTGTGLTADSVCLCYTDKHSHPTRNSIGKISQYFREDDPIGFNMHVDDGTVPVAASTSATGITLYGLWHFNNRTVSAVVGGLDCGDYQVANGQIFVPWAADEDGVLSLAYLATLGVDGNNYGILEVPVDGNFNAPIVVGYSFISYAKLLRGIAPNKVQTRTGPALADTRRNNMFGMLIVNGVNNTIWVGSDDVVRQLQLTNPNGQPIDDSQLYTGVVWDTLDGDYNFDGQFTVVVKRPVPFTLAAVNTFGQVMERA